ncbi:MAG: NADH-quinone oxidoreductase subunit C [Candidatus Eisenbacteria bacterium]
MSEVTAVDHLYRTQGGGDRFDLVYLLHNLTEERRIAVKTSVPESDPVVATAYDLWHAADWGEREVFDQYGVRFEGHPNLRRLLNHHEFVGHPLWGLPSSRGNG